VCVVVCVVTSDVIRIPSEEGVSAVGRNPWVGWIEKDGKEADFPTHESEHVYINDSVDVHVQLHVNPCYSWSAHLRQCVCLSV